METEWKGHTIRIVGDWTLRWLYLSVDYSLWIDDEKFDRTGAPRLHPTLEAMIEDDDGDLLHLRAEVLSIVGIRPECEITIGEDVVASGRVEVQNLLNPILMLFILASTVLMLYLGPSVLRQYL